MSFDVNVGSSQPMIRPAAGMANNGSSGGNCGYMMRRPKKKQHANSIFDINAALYYDDCFIDEKKYMQEVHSLKSSWLYKLYMFFQGLKTRQVVVSAEV